MEWILTAATVPGSIEFAAGPTIGWLGLAVAVAPLLLAARHLLTPTPRPRRHADVHTLATRPALTRRAA